MSSTTELNYKELYEQLLKEHKELQEKHIQYKKDNESRIEELKHLDTNSLFFSLSKEELRECITRLEIKAKSDFEGWVSVRMQLDRELKQKEEQYEQLKKEKEELKERYSKVCYEAEQMAEVIVSSGMQDELPELFCDDEEEEDLSCIKCKTKICSY